MRKEIIMNKNTEIAVVNNYTALKDFNLAEAMASELSGMNISFDRVSVPAAGGLAFELPGEMPGETDMAKEFTGVILFHHPLFTYYRDSFTGGNNPPDCGSYDGVYGVGDPGGRCDKCPLNQFGSDPNGGKAWTIAGATCGSSRTSRTPSTRSDDVPTPPDTSASATSGIPCSMRRTSIITGESTIWASSTAPGTRPGHEIASPSWCSGNTPG